MKSLVLLIISSLAIAGNLLIPQKLFLKKPCCCAVNQHMAAVSKTCCCCAKKRVCKPDCGATKEYQLRPAPASVALIPVRSLPGHSGSLFP